MHRARTMNGDVGKLSSNGDTVGAEAPLYESIYAGRTPLGNSPPREPSADGLLQGEKRRFPPVAAGQYTVRPAGVAMLDTERSPLRAERAAT